MSNHATQTTKGFNCIFIHSSLDEAGLTPQQFRVLAHIMRRAGDGTSWASNASMAATCRITEETVSGALKELERRKIIVRKFRPGFTTLFTVNSPDLWDLDPPESNHPPQKNPPPESDPGQSPQRNPPEGYPRKVIQGKRSKAALPPPVSPSCDALLIEEIWQAYPLKVGKPKAIAAIIKAVKRGIAGEQLLELTRDFAKRRGADLDFCPHPTTWFNQERYNDNPKTWERNEDSKNGVRPNPRLAGVSRSEVNDYAAAAQRKEQRQAAERAARKGGVGAQVAEAGHKGASEAA